MQFKKIIDVGMSSISGRSYFTDIIHVNMEQQSDYVYWKCKM